MLVSFRKYLVIDTSRMSPFITTGRQNLALKPLHRGMFDINSFTAMDADPRPIFECHVGSIIFSQIKYIFDRETHVYKSELLAYHHAQG